MAVDRLQRVFVGALCAWLLFALVGGAALSIRSSAASPRQPGAVIPACDPISANTTWTTGDIYVVQDCNLTIASGATLTIEPGVIVKFWGSGSAMGSAAVIVDGALNAIGTAAQPIIFTSYADDTRGGDTNGNGSSSGAAGDWYGLVFRPGSTGQLEHFFVGHAGSGVFNATLGYGRAQIDAKQADVQLRHGTVISGLQKGIYLEGAGMTPVIQDVLVADNHAGDGRGYAIYQASINMQPAYSDLTFSGNDRNEVTIGDFGGDLTQDVTLGGTNFGFYCGYTLCQLTVPNGRTLTVQPGALLDFRPSFGIAVASGGSLIAEGTAAEPITFTSQLAAAGTPNQHWMGLWAKQGSTLRLDHCDIGYADDGNYGNGGLEIDTNDAQVRNCRIHHNRRTGLYIYSRDGSSIHPTLTNVDVTDNGEHGVYLGAGSGSATSVTWDGGSVSRNGWSGVTAYTWNNTINPTLRNLTVADNGATGDFDERRAGIYWSQQNVSPTLENLTLTGNVGAAALWYCNGTIAARNLIATGNGTNALLLPGCGVGGGRQWDLDGVGIPVQVTGNIEVAGSSLLSILPGSTLRFAASAALIVKDQGALYALGTAAKPIAFTGIVETPGSWVGINAGYPQAALVLNHCEIAYGGSGSNAALYINGHSGLSPAPVQVQNCEIHHSARKGVLLNWVWAEPPVFRYNNIHDNVEEGVANWNAPPLDARDNYWGDLTGPYHATQNPGGLGNRVGDNILFYPWLDAPSSGGEAPVAMLVSTGAPTLISPGETVDYAIQYLNGMTETVRNGLLVVQLPGAAEYLESSGGGIYWPERDQVFWKLGDLPAGSQGFLSFRVRFAWGLPQDFSDSSITLLTADNYNPGELAIRPYLDFRPGAVNDVSLMSQAQFNAQMAASPGLQAAYNTALTAGYTFHSAANVTRSEGETVLEGVMVKSGRQAARILAMQAGQMLVYTISSGEVTVEDDSGGMRIDLTTGEKSEWGDWAPNTSLSALSRAADGCLEDVCKRNCRVTILGWEYIKKKAGRVVGWTALAPFTGGGSVAGAVWEIGSTVKKLYDCDLDCRANPTTYCCTAGQVRWSGSGLFDRLTNSCYREKCNAAVGMWVPDGYKTCIAYGQRCVAGIGGPGCVDCEERGLLHQVQVQTVAVAAPVLEPERASACNATAAGGKPRCRDLDLRLAKDPNAIYGLDGDLIPGQTVTYTITYENEGAGRAYGVYVINQLPEVFNASTLNFVHNTGRYLPESREIFWLVGELAPKGAASSTGVITYTVALAGGLPSGTVAANQAVVYFPSVPEETPTNTWVNLLAPLVAIPQNRTTAYMTPLPLTLDGREISGLPLTYEVVEQPHGGLLSGTAPHLTYTPVENFTGVDAFTFRVSNGASTSRPAQVLIGIRPNGDTTRPQVLWTSPTANATGISASATPVFTDTVGPAYSPVILIGSSEALNPATVGNATVMLARSSGTAVATSATFDSAFNQIMLTPRVALVPGEYRVTITTAVTDAAGNGLAAPHTWRFTVGAAANERHIYLPIVLKP